MIRPPQAICHTMRRLHDLLVEIVKEVASDGYFHAFLDIRFLLLGCES